MNMRKSQQVKVPGIWGLIGMCLVTACSRDAGQEETASSPPPVDVVEVETTTLTTERSWSDALRPLRRLPLIAPTSGMIADLNVTEGRMVTKGDALVRVDDPELIARQTVLREREKLVTADWGRWQRLADADAAGPGEVEAAHLRVLEVREALAEVDARLARAALHAPVAGRVVGLTVSADAAVDAGDLLMHLEETASMGLRLRVPAVEAPYFSDLDKLSLRGTSDNGWPIARVVVAEDPVEAGYLQVEVWIDSGEWWSAEEVELLYTAERETVLVPWTAVARDDDQHWVAVVNGTPPTIERRQVVMGSGQATGVEVRTGLQAGELVLRFEPRAHPEGREVSLERSR